MTTKKLSYTLNGWKYEQSYVDTNIARKIRPVGTPANRTFAGHIEYPMRGVISYEGDFVIDIDLPALLDMIVHRAAMSKGGKGIGLGGLITARRVKHVELSRDVKLRPVQKGYEEVPPA